MSALSDATSIAALSNELHNILNAATIDPVEARRVHSALCAKLTRCGRVYASALGLTPAEIDTAIQGGGVPKSA